ncbi:MAG: hypothetical protein IPJ20_11020 [Flammeovirgaceae bacterium]|nr:hypothetical protein [Flammeovirgaceae bacterium]
MGAQSNTFPATGNVGIGISVPAFSLDVSGTIRSYGHLRTTGVGIGNGLIADDGSGSTIFSIIRQPNNETRFQSYGFHTFYSGNSTGSEKMRITGTGNVGIGTTNTGSFKLAVAGKIAANEEVRVFIAGTTVFPDYVFDPSYELPKLEETEKYIKENRHLPEVPSAADVEKNGMSLNDMNVILLKKVEELTLYMIEMKKENKELKERIEKIENKK